MEGRIRRPDPHLLVLLDSLPHLDPRGSPVDRDCVRSPRFTLSFPCLPVPPAAADAASLAVPVLTLFFPRSPASREQGLPSRQQLVITSRMRGRGREGEQDVQDPGMRPRE